jgi:hypothetical protein
MFAIYTTPITESVNGFEALPIRYKEYEDVFYFLNANLLLQHHLYDCAIDLQESIQPLFGPIYNLSQNKPATLQEYLDENLAKNFIQHSKSLAGTLIFFIKKKNGSLQIYVD